MNKHIYEHLQNKTLLIWKMAIASAIAWQIAKLAGSHHPYFAPISVILCLQTTINRSIRFSYHRMVGTVIGISVTVLAAPHVNVTGWTIGFLILIGCFIAKWLKTDETAIHQVALTILLVFVVGQKSGDYPMDRFRDTLIGAIVAVVLHMLVYPPNFTNQASKRIHDFSERLTTNFQLVSEWIRSGVEKQEGCDLQTETKKLLEELHQTKKLIHDASESLRYNPFAQKSKKELQDYQKRIIYLTQGYSFLADFVSTFQAWSGAFVITEKEQVVWADQLNALVSFFQANENPAKLSPPGEIVKVSIHKEFEKQQYHISLYQETIALVKKLKNID